MSVLRWFKKGCNIVLTGNEAKGYGTRSQGSLWRSLTGNGRHIDGCKSSTGEFFRGSSRSERDV